jgi:peptidoglycan hydrolase-like protein with peptidoglycan-binding domain
VSSSGEEFIGSFVGKNFNDGEAIEGFWDNTVATTFDGCGSGEGSECVGVEGKSTALMTAQSMFDDAGYDFETIWGINDTDNDEYPFLRYQGFTHGETEPTPTPVYVPPGAVSLPVPVPVTNPQPKNDIIPPLECSARIYPTQTIKLGATNNPEQVKLLQQYLNMFEKAQLPVTGIYTEKDAQAVIAWQEKYASDVLTPWKLTKGTGYIYSTSLEKFKSIFLAQCQGSTSSVSPSTSTSTSPSVPSTIPVRNLQSGMKGNDVVLLQKLLIAEGYSIPRGATGTFGPQTRSALSQYQSKNGITPASGFFGAKTRTQMKGSGVSGSWW